MFSKKPNGVSWSSSTLVRRKGVCSARPPSWVALMGDEGDDSRRAKQVGEDKKGTADKAASH